MLNQAYLGGVRGSSKRSFFKETVYVFVLISAMVYCISSRKNCDIITKFRGAQITHSSNKKYIFASLPSTNKQTSKFSFFIDLIPQISRENSCVNSTFNIRIDVMHYIRHAPSIIYHRKIDIERFGLVKLYSSGIDKYQSVIAQININGCNSDIKKVVLSVITPSVVFLNETSRIKLIFFFINIVILIFYIIGSIINKASNIVERYITILLISLSVVSNSFDLFGDVLSNELIYTSSLFLSGFIHSVILVSIILLLFLDSESDTLSVLVMTLLFSSLFEGLSRLTNDSTIIYNLFENNDIAYIFFKATSVLIRVYLILLIVYREIVVIKYVYYHELLPSINVIVFLEIVSWCVTEYMFNVNKYENSSYLFFYDYILVEILVILFADSFWPTRERRSNARSFSQYVLRTSSANQPDLENLNTDVSYN